MDLDTVRLGRFFGLGWIGWIFVGSGFNWFLFGLDFLDFRWIGFFGFFRIWIWTVFSGSGFGWFFVGSWFSFQSGLDLKRYFQITFNKQKKKLTDTGF